MAGGGVEQSARQLVSTRQRMQPRNSIGNHSHIGICLFLYIFFDIVSTFVQKNVPLMPSKQPHNAPKQLININFHSEQMFSNSCGLRPQGE